MSLEEEIKRLNVERQLPISLIMADLNGLKIINDTYGHDKGDVVLVKTAEILKKCCRDEDIVARWGGDEFIILLPKTEGEDAEKICSRIEKEAREVEKDGLPISIGLGAATQTNLNQDIYQILKQAEKSFETERHINQVKELAYALEKKLNLSR